MLKDLEKRFDELYKEVNLILSRYVNEEITGKTNRRSYLKLSLPIEEKLKKFIKEEIEKAFEEIMPKEWEMTENDYKENGELEDWILDWLLGYNSCKGILKKNINNYLNN